MKWIKALWALFALGILALVLLFAGASMGLFGPLPSFEELENPDIAVASEVISADGVVLGKIYRQNRVNAEYEELPKHLVDALISTEDARFRKHSGVDLKSTLRAIVFLGKRGGGSTLTQQLAKMLVHDRQSSLPKRVIQKVKEYIVAIRLEKRYTKNEILAMYLNQLDFVNNAIGVKSAARIYFNKTLDELSIEEAATLVGMAKNPSLYNPNRNEERKELTRGRRNVVIRQMVKYGKLDRREKDSLQALALNLDFKRDDHNTGLAPYLRSVIQNDFLKEWIEKNPRIKGEKYDMYRDGLKIYTTIDSRMQALAEDALEGHLVDLQKDFDRQNKARDPWKGKKEKAALEIAIVNSERYQSLKRANKSWSKDKIKEEMGKKENMLVYHPTKGEVDTLMSPMDSIKYHRTMMQSAFVVVDPGTGHIKSWVGGRDFKYFKLDHATTKRQVGSTFKPFLYTVAINNGWSPCFQVPNLPVSIQTKTGKVWTPKNAGQHAYTGEPVTLKYGLQRSWNNISAYLINEIGPRPVMQFTERLGLEDVPEVYSIALGTTEQSVLDMAHAYTAYANRGISTEPIFVTRIEDKNGNVLAQFVPESVEAMRPELAYTMLQMMRNVVTGGTGIRLNSRYGLSDVFIAGKTGTTDDHSDGWFVGLTPELIGVVWTGCDDPVLRFRRLSLGGGNNMALPVFGRFFRELYKKQKELGVSRYANFVQPDFLTVSMDCDNYYSPGIDFPTQPGVESGTTVPPVSDGGTVEPVEDEEDFQ